MIDRPNLDIDTCRASRWLSCVLDWNCKHLLLNTYSIFRRNRAQLTGKGVTTVIKSDILLNYVAQPRIHDFATQFVKSNTKSSVT